MKLRLKEFPPQAHVYCSQDPSQATSPCSLACGIECLLQLMEPSSTCKKCAAFNIKPIFFLKKKTLLGMHAPWPSLALHFIISPIQKTYLQKPTGIHSVQLNIRRMVWASSNYKLPILFTFWRDVIVSSELSQSSSDWLKNTTNRRARGLMCTVEMNALTQSYMKPLLWSWCTKQPHKFPSPWREIKYAKTAFIARISLHAVTKIWLPLSITCWLKCCIGHRRKQTREWSY